MLKTRVLTAIIGIPFLILFLLIDPIWLASLAAIASIIGINEFYKACGVSNKKGISIVGYITGAALCFGAWFSKEIYMIIIILTLLALFYQMLVNHKNVNVDDISKIIFGIIYISFFLSNVIYIRVMDNGQYYIWITFLGAFITDSCAYFVGCAIGKHKLCPEISPKKTIEGAIGGVVGTGIVFIVFSLIVNHFFATDFNLIKTFLLGIIVAIISQMGDLSASIIKRKYGIKDFGNLLPGHGGILDRCDSLIMVAPVMYMYLQYIGL